MSKASWKTFVVLFCFFTSGDLLLAQEENNLTIPSTPAFSILEFEPASVMRPGNPRELGADILNSFDENGKLLLNIGMELSPYWITSKPYLTREKYFSNNLGQTILQSFLLSAATVRDSASGNNRLGTGFRFKLHNGNVPEEYKKKISELEQRFNVIGAISAAKTFSGVTIQSVDEVIEFIRMTLVDAGYSQEEVEQFTKAAQNTRMSGNYQNDREGINQFIEDLNDKIDRSYHSLKEQVVELSRKRTGWILETGGAAGFASRSGQNFERAGIWVNASNFVTLSDAFNFSARYLFSNRDSAITNFDIGISYIKELSRFSVAIEGMFRWYRVEVSDVNLALQPITRLEKDFTYRLSLQSAYKISDELSVNLSLGKDFDSPFFKNESFFSIFGVSYSLFRKSLVNVTPEQ